MCSCQGLRIDVPALMFTFLVDTFSKVNSLKYFNVYSRTGNLEKKLCTNNCLYCSGCVVPLEIYCTAPKNILAVSSAHWCDCTASAVAIHKRE